MIKSVLFFTLAITINYCGSAQTATTDYCSSKTILSRSTDMTNEQFSDKQIIVLHNISYSKAGPAAPDVNYYDINDPDFNDCGTNAPDCNYDGSALTYDVYFPSTFVYPCYKSTPLPAIFLFAGSGFSDCYDSAESTDDYCMAFAKRGFVAFNVNYRKGRLKNPDSKALTASQLLAMYRAFQDGRGAIRTVIARNNYVDYKIDTSNIFIGGISAGGEIALNIAYAPTESMNEQTFVNIAPVLGVINADYYKGSSNISFSVKGVLNLWGAAFTAGSMLPVDFFNLNSYNPPLIAFHGLQDNVLWPKTTQVYLSQKAPYNSESKCLLPDLNGLQTYTITGSFSNLYQSGSAGLYDILTSQIRNPVPCELYLDSDMGHGLHWNSDFGFGDGKISNSDLKNYIVKRAATFFQAVVNKKAGMLSTTKFLDCVNYRIKACNFFNMKDSNACSSNQVVNSLYVNNALQKNDHSSLYTLSQSYKKISVHMIAPGYTKIKLLDLNGVLLKDISSDGTDITIDCNDLKTNVYLLNVIQGSNMQRSKIMLP